ncbi:hypothetical protein IAR55_005038 [Kwoniella newhampshirensis]|uniref:tRNA (uracil-O(2)-)-methyltransferase n=1 Tax=Kwoniella newhampshirensis TaxID=1651941 RepID=A0AAW0Z008_9TREE
MAAPPPVGGYKTPPFQSTPYASTSTSPLSTNDEKWSPVLHSTCHFPLSVFLSTMKTLSLHPERNSSVILRADPLPPSSFTATSSHPHPSGRSSSTIHTDFSTKNNEPNCSAASSAATRDVDESDREEGKILDLDLVEHLRVRLMPKQPRRDGKLNQTINFYRTKEDDHNHIQNNGKGKEREVGEGSGVDPESEMQRKEEGLVIMIPEVKGKDEIPYYHPVVRKIAFRWESVSAAHGAVDVTTEDDGQEGGLQVKGLISIHYLPFADSPATSPSTVPSNSTPIQNSGSSLNISLAPRAAKARRRSPLAGPSIDDETTEPTRPPAIILSDTPLMDEQTKADGPVPMAIQSVEATVEETKRREAEQNRLRRTCLALLERLYKHGYGQLVGYQKRKVHDVVVPRDSFQDLYLVLKDRHRHLDSRAPRPTSTKLEDVKRHVWKGSLPNLLSPPTILNLSPDDTPLTTNVDISEWGEQDVAIAAFLMLLWKDMYPAREKSEGLGNDGEMEESREWDIWGRPEGGFVDLGCGNGLLVHILISEGYHGKGYELRSRRTWPLYPPKTQESLVELPIDPLAWFPNSIEEWEAGSWPGKESCVVKDGVFLIGNHSDELTPWLPLLSVIPSKPVPHLSLPCCLHTLDSTFDSLEYTPPPHPHTPNPDQGGFEAGLEPGVSRYKSYLIWLGWCGLKCGWEWEKEGLRVPSTKGWGIIARKRWTTKEEDDRECRLWVLEEVNTVRRRGTFKVREKEGKEH